MLVVYIRVDCCFRQIGEIIRMRNDSNMSVDPQIINIDNGKCQNRMSIAESKCFNCISRCELIYEFTGIEWHSEKYTN